MLSEMGPLSTEGFSGCELAGTVDEEADSLVRALLPDEEIPSTSAGVLSGISGGRISESERAEEGGAVDGDIEDGFELDVDELA